MDVKGIDWNLNGYKAAAHFFLCGAFESFHFIRNFLHTIQERPWLLKDNVIIDSVFGSPTCIWNGGRSLDDVYYNKQLLCQIHDEYEKLGIKVRFIFTNPLLNEYDLHDRYCNLVVDIFQDISPEVVINSTLLEEYLRNKYPSLSFISSTTKRLRVESDQMKEFDKDYKYICLDYDYNYNMDFLESIPKDERDRVEILVNSICPKGCKARVLHQKFCAERQLAFDNDNATNPNEAFVQECPLRKRRLSIPYSAQGYTKEYLSSTNYILPQDLNNYIDMGFSHFKIQGRELSSLELFAEAFPYLIKPEFYQLAISLVNEGYRNFKNI